MKTETERFLKTSLKGLVQFQCTL